jgi:polysaccharide deacetylase family protein (PEP-CTERM system associated)
MLNALTIDVEEYFHPSELFLPADVDCWSGLPSRIEAQMAEVLELLDRANVKATFFVLGWIADRYPKLVAAIAQTGHEIACHSYAHRLVYDLSPDDFRRDTERAVAAIEAACGVRPRGYRAPSYSITSRSLWSLEILVECGFTYDSSIYPISHDRYGIPGFERQAQILNTPSGPIQEIPIATAILFKQAIAPVGGGAYLRLLPYRYTAAGIRCLNEHEKQPACIYFHPWELDPTQPRLATGVISRLRTYAGLAGMKTKIRRLLSDFAFSTIASVYPTGQIRRGDGRDCSPVLAGSTIHSADLLPSVGDSRQES